MLKIKFIIPFLIIVLGIFVLTLAAKESSGDTIIVAQDGNGDYDTIQDAIDNATEGDTIRVYEGTYQENVVINKTVNLIGNGSEATTIDGEGSGSVVMITVDWVNMSGFRVTKEKITGYGIRISGNHTTVSENHCTLISTGIGIFNGHFNTLNNNICNFTEGFGILLSGANNNLIMNNDCGFNYLGIHLGQSENNVLSDNVFSNNFDLGIHIDNSDNNAIKRNMCSNNHCGIDLYGAHYNTFSDNICTQNEQQGIYLYTSDNNTMMNNTCSDNDSGIYTHNSNGNEIISCTVTNNGIGIWTIRSIHGTSRENSVHYSTITGNNNGIKAPTDPESTVIATYNWWGSITGPYHATNNSDGEGDNVTDNVEFEPWLNTPYLQPKAFIDSILPSPALVDEEVQFSGHGTSSETIVLYRWRSNLDEVLYSGTETSFSISGTDLSSGDHLIYLKVQDSTGYWSAETSSLLIIHEQPVAKIDSISPNPAIEGETVTLIGIGTDDGAVVQYMWTSSADGETYNGTDATFNITTLSPGEHTISLKVQDNNGAWSDEISMTLTITKKETQEKDTGDGGFIPGFEMIFLIFSIIFS